jgi:hypothetical protein
MASLARFDLCNKPIQDGERDMRNICLLAGAIMATSPLLAQPGSTVERDVIVVHGQARAGARVMHAPAPGMEVSWIASEFGWSDRTVKNAPYSADAVTETTQTLADGNRIQRKSSSQIFRDGEGRVRREHTLDMVGPWAAGKPHRSIFINDPVANVNWVLEPETKTARKGTVRSISEKIAGLRAGRVAGGAPPPPPPPPPPGAGVGTFEVMTPPVAAGYDFTFERKIEGIGPASFQDAKTEQLGKQIIEGVQAEGARTTFTIPAGRIGNDRAIEIVSEQWYSPELQTVVMTRRSDPRTGETIYKLTNIQRSEPGRHLFEPPADYTVKEVKPDIEIFGRE